MPQNDGQPGESATYENEGLFRDDADAVEAYHAYLADHDARNASGGVPMYADDFVTWLNFDRWGQEHRDRVLTDYGRPDDE